MLSAVKKYANAIVLAFGLLFMTGQAALAQSISEQTAEAVSDKVVSLVSDLLLPFGGAVIFIAIVISSIKIILSSGKPTERAEAIASLPYIIGGGVLLGGSMIAAGFVLGLWSRMQ